MKRLYGYHNQKGYIKFALVTIILAFGIYIGVKFGIPYYKYSAFQSDVRELARISLGNTEKTKAQIFERAQELKLPLDVQDILVVRQTYNRVRVTTSWDETVDVLGLYQKVLHFSVDVEE